MSAGDAKFVSTTYRVFKLLSNLEKPTNVKYKGTLIDKEKEFDFDINNTFKVSTSEMIENNIRRKSLFGCDIIELLIGVGPMC